ncbi:type II toxin-antitoxin system VapC family toxin [Dyadobacter sandarakinus]|uniref:PIN domain-containing protein n=1 Tax=Dyadobacter sandarakinus TaxID=2747268 RepID=A0ABX7ICK5_9BACT|nr:PIN domain-containing protein [Dyadobacter sandarakinus]QRR03844.1 PIN domain-containing protein [Dyadobacter sandarakinus]
MIYVLDTNVILAYFRKNAIRYVIESVFDIYESEAQVILPAIIIGELRSLSIQNGWGKQKITDLEEFVTPFIPFPELTEDIIVRYAEIDAFSQGRLPGKRLELSARNMGKNDLWIAAITSTLNAILITTDRDFDHLHNHFLNVARFDLN